MAEVSIEKLATDIGTSVDRLVQQFKSAGIDKAAGGEVTEDEKRILLDFLSKQHGGTKTYDVTAQDNQHTECGKV
jgi:translation initiation factor IF-2